LRDLVDDGGMHATRGSGIEPRIDGVIVCVRNMRQTLAFYRLLGLEMPAVPDGEGFVTLQHHGLHLAWCSDPAERALDPGRRRPTGHGQARLTVRCGTCFDVDVLYRKVVEAGCPVLLEPCDAPWGARCCRVLDPDGVVVELFAPFP
jgi:catechol 2,3-dioxygenase-like lactoylglutathione lyase family enzyme